MKGGERTRGEHPCQAEWSPASHPSHQRGGSAGPSTSPLHPVPWAPRAASSDPVPSCSPPQPTARVYPQRLALLLARAPQQLSAPRSKASWRGAPSPSPARSSPGLLPAQGQAAARLGVSAYLECGARCLGQRLPRSPPYGPPLGPRPATCPGERSSRRQQG